MVPLLMPTLHARDPFILLMMLLFPTLGKPKGKRKCAKESVPWTIDSECSIHQGHWWRKKEKEKLTDYADSEWTFNLCFISVAYEQLCKTTVSKAGCSSGSVQHFIRGHYPALFGFLMKSQTEISWTVKVAEDCSFVKMNTSCLHA